MSLGTRGIVASRRAEYTKKDGRFGERAMMAENPWGGVRHVESGPRAAAWVTIYRRRFTLAPPSSGTAALFGLSHLYYEQNFRFARSDGLASLQQTPAAACHLRL